MWFSQLATRGRKRLSSSEGLALIEKMTLIVTSPTSCWIIAVKASDRFMVGANFSFLSFVNVHIRMCGRNDQS